MERRYGWQREYKGSHPRGNLSTPDYRAARAKERQEEYERQMKETFDSFSVRMDKMIEQLHASAENAWRNDNGWEIVIRYLTMCSKEEYLKYIKRVEEYISTLPQQEHTKMKKQLHEIVKAAELKSQEQLRQSGRSRREQQR